MSKCDSCKWWMSFKRSCLLGRTENTCTTQSARRGDDELISRMVDMPPKEFERLRKEFREQKGDKEVSFHKKDEWG